MKRRLTLVVILCMTVAFTMCFSGSAFAASDTTSTTVEAVPFQPNKGVDKTTTLFKITADKTGYLYITDYKIMYKSLTNQDYADGDNMYGYISLLDSNKKALTSMKDDWYEYYSNSDSSSNWMKYLVYGVKKGSTYYIRVNDSSYGNYNYYNMSYYISGVNNKSGASKSKAKTLKKGKYVEGSLVAGSSRTDWYKYKKTKSKVVIYLKPIITNYDVNITVYQRGKSVYHTFGRGDTVNYKYTFTSNMKGTIYIKMSRNNKYSSGYYKIKIK